MKLKLLLPILCILVVLTAPSVLALEGSSSNFKANFYMGNGGNSATIGDAEVSQGIGQNIIGDIKSDNFVTRLGIFYIEVPYTLSEALAVFTLMIKDFGIEWVTVNWTN